MNDILKLADESYFLIEEWQKFNPNLYAGFTTKLGGEQSKFGFNNFGFHVNDDAEHVLKNRLDLSDKLNFPLNSWVCSEQTHNNNIVQVFPYDSGKGSNNYESSIKNSDGLYTKQPNQLLALTYADCVPIFFYSPKTNLIGIVHAGWRGTVTKIGEELIKQWIKLGIDQDDILAVIGPSICNLCYIVDNKVISEVKRLNLPDIQNYYHQINDKEYSLNLQGLNKAILLQHIPESNVKVTNYCTSCQNEMFYSHRKELGKTGRMIGFIGIRED